MPYEDQRRTRATARRCFLGVVKDIRNLIYNLGKPVAPFYFLPEARMTVLEN